MDIGIAIIIGAGIFGVLILAGLVIGGFLAGRKD